MATVNGAVVSKDGSLTSLYINEDLTIEGSAYTSVASARSKGTVGVAAGEYTESRASYSSVSLYGVAGAEIGHATYEVTSNTNGEGGALMYIGGGNNRISGVTISDNTLVTATNLSRVGGGAIINNNSGAGTLLTIENSVFTRNVSGSAAGAIFVRVGNAVARDTVFSYNYAVGNGGAVRMNKQTDFYGVTFTGNTSKSRGGAVSLNCGAILCHFENNGDNITSFDHNVAANGGALDVSDGGISVSDVAFSNNVASACGGAISVNTTSDVDNYILNSTFTDNFAQDGGAISIEGGTESITTYLGNLTFHGNTAAGAGGALYMKTGASATIIGLLTLETATDTIRVASGTLNVDAEEVLTGGKVYAKVIDTKFSSAYITGGSIGLTDAENYQFFTSRNDLYVAPNGVTYDDSTVYVDAASASDIAVTEVSGQTILRPLYTNVNEAFATGVASIVVRQGVNAISPRIIASDRTVSGETTGAILSGAGIEGSNLTISGMTFTGNTIMDGYGGALYLTGVNQISDSVFDGNTLGSSSSSKYFGGAIYMGSGTTTIERTTFSNNAARNSGRGDSIYAAGGTLLLNDIYSSGNTTGYTFWFNDSSTVTIQNSTIEDAILARGTLTVAGDVHLRGTISFYAGSITVNGNMILDASKAMDLYHHTDTFSFGENGKLLFKNTGTVRFKINGSSLNFDLSSAPVAVDASILPGSEGASFTIASGIRAMGSTITVGSQTVTLGTETVIGGNTYTFAFDDGKFTVSRLASKYDTVALAPDGTESVVVCGTTYALEHCYDTLSVADAHLNAGGTMIVAGQHFAKNGTFGSGAATLMFADSDTASSGGSFSLYGNSMGDYTGDISVTMDRFTVQGDKLFLKNNGTVNGDWNVTLNAFTAENHGSGLRGITYLFDGGTVTGDANISISNSTLAGVFAMNSGRVDGVVNVTVTNSSFNGFTLSATSASGKLCGGVNCTVTDSLAGTIYGGGSSDQPEISGDISITLVRSTVTSQLVADRGHRISAERNISVTLAGSTVNSLAKFDYSVANYSEVKAPMTLTITGATKSIIGALYDADELVIDAGASVDFLTVQDLTATELTVDASLYAGAPITVATGVSGIGSYTILNPQAGLVLAVEDKDLVLTTAARIIDDNTQTTGSVIGGTVNVMTGGSIGVAFFGTNAASGDVTTTVSGGTIDNALIGGALVLQNSTASLGTVTLNLSGDASIIGGTANGGMLYTAGYAYGANPDVLDSSATLTVEKSVLNLTAGSVPVQNLYSGAHARKGAYTVVDQTEITVTGGSFGRIYGGGWAEKVGKSEVGTSTIRVTGGTVDYIYAGGGNAEGGESVVTGAVNISVTGDAEVGIVFLAGKNINCTTEGAVTMTVSGAAKTMSRVSGWNANGKENTSLTTLDLRTSLDVEYLDHVDVVRIAEGKTLNVSMDLWYEAAGALKIDFDLDGALDTDWTAMSGVGMNIYREAQYTIDGGSTVYTYDQVSGKLVNGTTESGYGLDFSEANKVKFVTIA